MIFENTSLYSYSYIRIFHLVFKQLLTEVLKLLFKFLSYCPIFITILLLLFCTKGRSVSHLLLPMEPVQFFW